MPLQPLVSVIIPTFNRARVIGKTIDDVFRQTYKNIEVVVIDDGSTDDTQATLQQYGSRVRSFTQTNAGPAAARNRGVEISCGDIIAFQDSDDYWAPTKLERQVRILDRAGDSVPCCLCNMLLKNLDRDGKDQYSFGVSLIRPREEEGIWLNVSEVLATRFVMFNQAAAIRRKAFEKVGGFDTSLAYLEDYDLPMRLSFEGPWAYIRDPLAIWAGGGPDSFGKRARDDEILLHDCWTRILERALASAEERGDLNVSHELGWRIALSRRDLKVLREHEHRSLSGRLMRHMEKYLKRIFFAILRRSPWFPKMRAISIEKFNAADHANKTRILGQENVC